MKNLLLSIILLLGLTGKAQEIQLTFNYVTTHIVGQEERFLSLKSNIILNIEENKVITYVESLKDKETLIMSEFEINEVYLGKYHDSTYTDYILDCYRVKGKIVQGKVTIRMYGYAREGFNIAMTEKSLDDKMRGSYLFKAGQ